MKRKAPPAQPHALAGTSRSDRTSIERADEHRLGSIEAITAPAPEDHIAGICEAMRFAIAVQQRTIEEQRMFFDSYLYRGGIAFCSAVTASGKADFYRRVALFARAYLELEREAFELP